MFRSMQSVYILSHFTLSDEIKYLAMKLDGYRRFHLITRLHQGLEHVLQHVLTYEARWRVAPPLFAQLLL